jgi:hypothetical protein
MRRELDALNREIVSYLLGPVAQQLVKHLSCHSATTLRELERAVRHLFLERVRRGKVARLSRSGLQATLCACLAKLVELGVVRCRVDPEDPLLSPCKYSLSSFAAVLLYGFPFLQRYILRLHYLGWRIEAQRASKTFQPTEPSQGSVDPNPDTSEAELERLLDFCAQLYPLRRVPVSDIQKHMLMHDGKVFLSQDKLQRLFAIGLLEQHSAEQYLAEALGITPSLAEPLRGDVLPGGENRNGPGPPAEHGAGTASVTSCREPPPSSNRVTTRAEAKPVSANQHLVHESPDHDIHERPQLRRRLRLRRLEADTTNELGNESQALEPSPRPALAPTKTNHVEVKPTTTLSTEHDSDCRDDYVSMNLAFVRDAIRDLHLAAWAAEQLHASEDFSAVSSSSQVHWRSALQQTAIVLNALFYLQRVAKYGRLVHVLPCELHESSWAAGPPPMSFTLEQIFFVIQCRFGVPSDSGLETPSLLAIEQMLSHLADHRLGFVKIYRHDESERYQSAYGLMLEQYRVHCIEGVLLASGDLYLHRIWRMVLDCGPLSTKSCEERALLPARAVRAYLFQLLHDGWIRLGDEWTSIMGATAPSVRMNPTVPHRSCRAWPTFPHGSVSADHNRREKRNDGSGTVHDQLSETHSLFDQSAELATTSSVSARHYSGPENMPDLEDGPQTGSAGTNLLTHCFSDTEAGWHVDLEAVYTNVVRLCVLSMQNVLEQIQMKRATLLEHATVLRATNKSGIEPRVYEDHVRGAKHAERQLKHLSESYYRLLETLLFFWDHPWVVKDAHAL